MGSWTYPVWKEGVSYGDGGSGSVGYALPPIWLLGDGTSYVVIAIEGVEGRNLHPAVAQFFVSVAICRKYVNSPTQVIDGSGA